MVNHSASTDNVLEELHAIMHLYRARQYRALRGMPVELSHMEVRVLTFFARHPGATQRDLVLYSGRDKAQLARLIRGLRDKGLLEARIDEDDRRNTLLEVSAEGKRIHKHLQAQGAQLAGIAVKGMDAEERARLQQTLARMRANLEQDRGGEDE